MSGIIFFENGDVEVIGKLNSVRLIALKVQEIIPDLIQQERNGIIDTMNEDEIRRAVDALGKRKNKDE